MSIYRAVRTHLMQYAGITRLVSGRIYRRDLPQEGNALLIESSNLPAIVLNEVSTLHHNTQDGDTGLDTTRLQIDVIGVDPSDVDDLYRVIRNCLSGFQGLMSQYDVRGCFQENKFDNRMHDIQRERITADYRILYQLCEPVTAGGASTNELLALDADFVGSPLTGTAPLTVQFYDRTSGALPASWLWNFDGTNTSNVQNPNFIYSSAGTYNVSLTATADGGNSDTETKTAYIVVSSPNFQDLFNGIDATNLTAHTPDSDPVGSGWQVQSGTWELLSNAAVSTASNNIYYIDTGMSDGTITLNVSVSNVASSARIIFRYQDGSNHWYVQLKPLSTRVTIVEVVAGTGTIRDTQFTGAWPATTNLNIVITLNDETISYVITGDLSETASYGSAAALKTQPNIGIIANSGEMTVEDILMEPL